MAIADVETRPATPPAAPPLSTPDPTPEQLAAYRQTVLDRIASLDASLRRRLVVAGVARVLGVAIGLAVLSLLIDRWLRLAVPTRLALLGVALAGLAWLAHRLIVAPLRRRLDPVSLTAAIDRHHHLAAADSHALAERVASVIQLPGLSDASPAMVNRAVIAAHAALDKVDFAQILDRTRLRRHTIVLAALVALPILFASVAPKVASLWAKRWLLASTQEWPRRTRLTMPGLTDGRLVVPRGEPFTLRVAAEPDSVAPESVSLRWWPASSLFARGAEAAAMTRFDARDFRFDFPTLDAPALVEIAGGDDVIGPVKLVPADRPRVAELTLTATPPTRPDGAQPPATQVIRFTGRDTEPAFFPGTQVQLEVTASAPIASARFVDPREGLAPTGAPATAPRIEPITLARVDDTHYVARWSHQKAVHLVLELVAAEAGLTSLPTPVTIGLRADSPPRVTLTSSGVRQRITPTARIPLVLGARDDVGVVSARLDAVFEAPEAAPPADGAKPTEPAGPGVESLEVLAPLHPSDRIDAQATPTFALAAGNRKALPGTLLTLTASATDEAWSGPQVGRSRPLAFRVVTPEELFRDVLVRQQAERARFRKARDEADALVETLAAAANTNAVAAAGRRFRTLQREAARVAATLADSLTEMKLNDLGGSEAHELMDSKVVQPLRRFDTQTLTPQRDLIDKLAAASSLDSKALSDAVAAQRRVVEEMNQILRQMSQWDSFVDVINQLDEVIKLQNRVKSQTESLKAEDTRKLFNP